MAQQQILLVEDSEPLRMILAEKLRSEGLDVIEAGGGEEGFRLGTEKQPDLVLTDLVMFPVDGIEMAIMMREKSDWGKQVKIVALTNQNENEEPEKMKRAQFTAYYVKAETALDDVVKQVKGLLSGKK